MTELDVRITPGGEGVDVRIKVVGELDVASSGVLRTAMDEARAAGRADIELELSQLTFCDSVGLCLLLRANGELRDEARTLRLVDPGHAMLRLLDLTGTRDVFEMGSDRSPVAPPIGADIAV